MNDKKQDQPTPASSPGNKNQGDSVERDKATVTIKKYANRRLYNTATSSYVTLEHLCRMVQEGTNFVVYDAKSGEDITRSVLTQIIVEEEGKGQNLLPLNFLRQLIAYYGDSMQWMVPSYLEQMMKSLAENQDRMRKGMQDAFDGVFPFSNLEEVSKQNMAMMESAMRMFTPSGLQTGKGASTPAEDSARHDTQDDKDDPALSALKAQVEMLQKQIEAMSRGTNK